MPIISVITAVLDGRHEYLLDAYESLRSQELPEGWSWQWVVQEDGTTGRPLAVLPDDPRIYPGKARRGRAATARTLALGGATGILVRTLDADDMLMPGALARDITTLIEHPEIGWCVSPALDLLPDGAHRPGPHDPAPGPLPRDLLVTGEEAGMLPVLGTTLCAYTDLVHTLGGWPAVPAIEDVALMLAAEAVADGWMLAEPSVLWRKWPGSSTAQPEYGDPTEEKARRTAAIERVKALRRSGWRWSPSEKLV